MSVINGEIRWRLEFIDYNGPHKLTYEAQMMWMGKIMACEASTLDIPRLHLVRPYTSLTAAPLFQCVNMSIMNGEIRWRLEFIDYNCITTS